MVQILWLFPLFCIKTFKHYFCYFKLYPLFKFTLYPIVFIDSFEILNFGIFSIILKDKERCAKTIYFETD